MGGGIKGITVKIGGDTTELGRSLSDATKKSTALQKELKGVNSLLKLDPSNVTLLKQKSDLLKGSISETKKKLDDLKEVLAKADSGEIQLTEEEYRNLQREIVSTELKLKDLNKQIDDFGSVGAQRVAQVGEKMIEVGDKMENAGKKLMPVTGVITGLGAVAIKTTADFDSAMSNVSAISGATGDDLLALRDKAREMGSQTKYSASESADAMSYMAMAGWKTEDMLDGIAGVMNLASASGEDLAKTSDILTDGLTAFGMSASESSRMADVMASASSNANTNVSLLGESYKYCASTAGALGYSVEDITESLGLMANAGVKGSQAGTTLKNAMINMAKPTKAMVGVMEKYNLSLTDQDGQMKSWNEVVGDLRTNLGGLSEAEQASAVATLFGKEATAGMLSLINAEEKDIKKLNKAITESKGSAEEMAKTMNDNLNGQLTILKSQLEELAISFGELIMPLVRSAVTFIQNLVDKLNNMTDAQRKVVLIIGAIVASIAPLLVVAGKMIKTIGTVLTYAPKLVKGFKLVSTAIGGISAPVVAIVALIGVLVGAFISLWKNNEEFRNKITFIWTRIVNQFTAFFNGIKERLNGLGISFESFGELIRKIWTELCNFLAPIFIGVFDYIRIALGTALDVILGVVDVFIAIFKGDWSGAWEAIKGIFTSIWNGIKTAFSTILDTVKEVANVFFGWFGTTWSEVWTTISTFFSGVWENIKTFFTNTVDSIKTTATNVFTAISDFFKATWESIRNTFTTVLGAILEVVGSVFNTMFNTVLQVMVTIWNTIAMVWNTISSTVSTVLEGIKTFITSIFEAIKALIRGDMDSVRSNVSTAWDAIKSIFTTVLNAIKTVVTTVWNGIKSVITTQINGIKTVISTVWEAIKTKVTTVLNSIKTTVTNVWNGIKTTITNTMNSIKTTVTNGWNSIKTTTSNAWNGVKTGVSNALTNTKTAISGAMTSIKSTVSGAWTSVKTATSNAWNGVKSTISNAITGAKTSFSNTVETIKTKARNIFTGIVPKLKLSLPHISVSGGEAPWGIAGKGRLPSFNVTWNKAGAIFKKPTVFDTRLGYQGVGEAGAEAVAPITELMKYVRLSIDQSGVLDRLDKLERTMSSSLGVLANRKTKIVLDTGILVGETIDQIDRGLADNQILSERGV